MPGTYAARPYGRGQFSSSGYSAARHETAAPSGTHPFHQTNSHSRTISAAVGDSAVMQSFFDEVAAVVEPDAPRRSLLTTQPRINDAISNYIRDSGGQAALDGFVEQCAGERDHARLVDLLLAASRPPSRKRPHDSACGRSDYEASESSTSKIPRLQGDAWLSMCQTIELLEGGWHGQTPPACAPFWYYGSCSRREGRCDRRHSPHPEQAGMYGKMDPAQIERSRSLAVARVASGRGSLKYGGLLHPQDMVSDMPSSDEEEAEGEGEEEEEEDGEENGEESEDGEEDGEESEDGEEDGEDSEDGEEDGEVSESEAGVEDGEESEDGEVDEEESGADEVIEGDADWHDEEYPDVCLSEDDADEYEDDNGGFHWRRRLLLFALSCESGHDITSLIGGSGREICMRHFCANAVCPAEQGCCEYEHVASFHSTPADYIHISRGGGSSYSLAFH